MLETLIKVTGKEGLMYVNPHYIATISAPLTSGGEGCNIFMCNDSSPLVVKESPEQVISLIQSLYE